MSLFAMLTDGRDPGQIGSGLSSQLERDHPGFEWVDVPTPVGPERYLARFRARDLGAAREIGLLVSVLGDADVEVWPLDEE